MQKRIILLLIAILLVFGLVASEQQIKMTQAVTNDPNTGYIPSENALRASNWLQVLPSDPEIVSGTLANGFKYFIKVNNKPENRVAFRLFVHAGSILEDEDQQGLAHFTEHMAFNGTKNFSRTELRDYLNSIGMGFAGGLNAYTSFDETVYQLSSPTDDPEKLRKAFLILSDWAHQLSFNDAELESERGIIIEEWRGGQGADERLSNQTRKVLFAGSRYAERLPIGTYEVLSTFKPDAIKRFYKDWYRPDLQELVVVGDVDPAQMEAFILQHFGQIPKQTNPRERLQYSVPDHIEPRAVVATDKEASEITLSLSWKHDPISAKTVQDYYRQICADLYLNMLRNRLDEIAQQADPPFSYAYSYTYNMTRSRSIHSLAAVVPEAKMHAALAVLMAEAERVKQHGFSIGELERAKQRILRNAERRVTEKNDQLSDRLIWQYVMQIRNNSPMLSPDQEFQLMSQIFPKITVEEVNAAAIALLTDENLVISLTGPEKKDLLYPSAEELLNIAQISKTAPLSAYQDDILDEPILNPLPKPGKIKKEKNFPKTGIKLWTLSNGIKVYAKQTELKKDEVLLSAFSAGGFSLLAAEDIPAATNLSGILQSSGFGNFDAVKLQKALSGTLVSANLQVDRYRELIGASSSPKDLELMFQMLYQYINAPRQDKVSFDSYIARAKGLLENRLLAPETVFFDSLSSILYSNNPYQAKESVENLLSIKLDRVYEIQRERFADWSDFEFVIVGNFDEAKLKDYCETYLANLPVAKRKQEESFRDVGLRSLSGIFSKKIYIGQDPKSIVFSRITGSSKYSPQEKLRFSAMTILLNERLRERIREERSGVYSIYAYGYLNKYPQDLYDLNIMMECSPERHEELSAEVIVVLNEMKNGDISEEEANFVRTTLQKRYEQDILSNRYWLNNMQENLWNKDDVEIILEYPEFYRSISPTSLKESAKKYLNHEQNYVRITKLPQE